MEVAFDHGINYVDTARKYMGGKNEEIVGRALKGRRRSCLCRNENPACFSIQSGHFQGCGNEPENAGNGLYRCHPTAPPYRQRQDFLIRRSGKLWCD